MFKERYRSIVLLSCKYLIRKILLVSCLPSFRYFESRYTLLALYQGNFSTEEHDKEPDSFFAILQKCVYTQQASSKEGDEKVSVFHRFAMVANDYGQKRFHWLKEATVSFVFKHCWTQRVQNFFRTWFHRHIRVFRSFIFWAEQLVTCIW